MRIYKMNTSGVMSGSPVAGEAMNPHGTRTAKDRDRLTKGLHRELQHFRMMYTGQYTQLTHGGVNGTDGRRTVSTWPSRLPGKEASRFGQC
jgi:hypothetical protein